VLNATMVLAMAGALKEAPSVQAAAMWRRAPPVWTGFRVFMCVCLPARKVVAQSHGK